MEASDNIALIHRVLDLVNQNEMAAFRELVGPGFVRHDLAGMIPDAVGRAGVTDFLQMLRVAVPDMRIMIDDIFATDDRVAVRLHLEGTHGGEFLGVRPTGKAVTMHGINLYRIEDGKVAETWQMTDWVGMLRQIGVDA